LGHSPNPYFDEAWYLAKYQGIQQAVRAGQFRSGFEHFCKHGHSDLSPHWLFDPWYYGQQFRRARGRAFDPQLDGDIYDHFLKIGQFETLSGHWFFDPAVYADLAPFDVLSRIRQDGAFTTFLNHIHAGGAEPAVSNLFQPGWYKARYAAVSQDIARGRWVCALHHYLANEQATRFDANARFSEQAYAACHKEVAAAIEAGAFRNSFDHFLRHGRAEGRYFAPPGVDAACLPLPDDPKDACFPLRKRMFDEVTFLPVGPDERSATGHSFGVLDRDGLPIRAFDHSWFEMRTDDAPVRREPGVFMYGGVLMHQFGHFLVDSMPNLRALRDSPDLPVLWHRDPFAPPDHWPSWIDELLRLLGLGQHRHVHILAPVTVGRVILPDSGRPTNYGIHPWLVRAMAVCHCTRARAGNRVWLSRRGADPGRRIGGEDQVEAVLAARGWMIVRPEDLPVADQADIFATAAVVSGCIGSAFHAVLLSSSPTARLILVDRPGVDHAYYDAIARALDLRQCYVVPGLKPALVAEPGMNVAFADPGIIADIVCDRADGPP
jgi:hypothetical protein